MVTLHWPGFPALINWLTRGEQPVDGCGCVARSTDPVAPPAAPESAAQRAERWADEAAGFPPTPVRWGNFR